VTVRLAACPAQSAVSVTMSLLLRAAAGRAGAGGSDRGGISTAEVHAATIVRAVAAAASARIRAGPARVVSLPRGQAREEA
jgi:hypothetical protein